MYSSTTDQREHVTVLSQHVCTYMSYWWLNLTYELLNGVHEVDVKLCDECDAFAAATCTCCATHAMHVVLGLRRHIVVDDQVDGGNIKTSVITINAIIISDDCAYTNATTLVNTIFNFQVNKSYEWQYCSSQCVIITELAQYLLATSVAMRIFVCCDLNRAKEASRCFWVNTECKAWQFRPTSRQIIARIWQYLHNNQNNIIILQTLMTKVQKACTPIAHQTITLTCKCL